MLHSASCLIALDYIASSLGLVNTKTKKEHAFT